MKQVYNPSSAADISVKLRKAVVTEPVVVTCEQHIRIDTIISAYMHLTKKEPHYHIIITPTHVARLEVFVKTARNLEVDHWTSLALSAGHSIVRLQPTLVNRLLGGVSCSTKADKRNQI